MGLSKLIVNFNILGYEKEISCFFHKEGSESWIHQCYIDNLYPLIVRNKICMLRLMLLSVWKSFGTVARFYQLSGEKHFIQLFVDCNSTLISRLPSQWHISSSLQCGLNTQGSPLWPKGLLGIFGWGQRREIGGDVIGENARITHYCINGWRSCRPYKRKYIYWVDYTW